MASANPNATFGTNDDLAVKIWAKKLFVESIKATQLDKFIGTGSDSVIQVKDELSKGAGDTLHYGLRMQLAGAGIAGDSTLDGQEESLVTYRDTITINQLRHAVKVVGNMSQQRVTFDIRAEAQAGLVDWWAQRLDASLINQLSGNTNPTNTNNIYSGMNAVINPTVTQAASGVRNYLASDHAILPDDLTADSNLSTVDLAEKELSDDGPVDAASQAKFAFNLRMLDKAVIKARTLATPIRPIKMNGMECYVAFLHPYQIYDLRRNTQSGQWMDIQKAALQGGAITKNPLFTGAVGMYSGVIIHEDARVPFGTSTGINAAHQTYLSSDAEGVARGIFCGAQAGCIAFGRAYGYSGSNIKFKWTEVLNDYENQLGVSSALVYGMKKTQFNSKDFGTIVMSSYSPGTGGTIKD
jgi:N4-gp56 family major capsid protein